MRYLIVSQDITYGFNDYQDGETPDDSYDEPKPVAMFKDLKKAESELKKIKKEQEAKKDRWGNVYFHILDLKDIKIG